MLKYAEEHSGEKAAKQFDIDPRLIWYWKNQKNELNAAEKKESLPGYGNQACRMDLYILVVSCSFCDCSPLTAADVYCYIDTAQRALLDKLFIWPSDIFEIENIEKDLQ